MAKAGNVLYNNTMTRLLCFQDGRECWCDDDFGVWGGQRRGNRCTQTCPETSGNSIRCGGSDANDVFAVNGKLLQLL